MKKTILLSITLLMTSLLAFNSYAIQDCSSDETKCWSDKIAKPSNIPGTPAKGIIGEKAVSSFYVEITKKDSMTDKKYVYFIPSNEKPATPCSRVKGDLIKIGFKNLPSKGTYSLLKSKGDKSAMMQTIAYHINKEGTLKSTSGKSDVSLIIQETKDKAKGWVSINFLDGKNKVEGSFEAHVCK